MRFSKRECCNADLIGFSMHYEVVKFLSLIGRLRSPTTPRCLRYLGILTRSHEIESCSGRTDIRRNNFQQNDRTPQYLMHRTGYSNENVRLSAAVCTVA